MAQTVSFRESIVEAIATLLENKTAGVDGYNTTWNKVYRGPLPLGDTLVNNAVCVWGSSEYVDNDFSHTRKFLLVMIEFWVDIGGGQTAETELNKMLVDIQRALLVDPSLGQLVMTLHEESNELTIELDESNNCVGTIEFEIQYRHNIRDPRNCN